MLYCGVYSSIYAFFFLSVIIINKIIIEINNKNNIIYCFIVITIAPTMASKRIIDVSINHKG